MNPTPPAQSPRHPLALRVPPLAVTAGFGVVAWVLARMSPALVVEASGFRWLAAVLFAAGLVVSLLGVAAFRRARTTVNPLTPDATSALVVAGIYHATRNPMYLGFLLFLLAEIAWLANPLALLTAPLFVLYLNRFQIAPEEGFLRARFGREFEDYAARVRRWI